MCPSNEVKRKEMSRVPYASSMESLIFDMICIRPDIAQAVGTISRHMSNPGREHWKTVKRILRYIRGTSFIALYYGGSKVVVRVYVDSDFGRDLDKKKSTTGNVFNTYRRSYKLCFKPAGCGGFIYNRSSIHGNHISL